MVSRVTKVYRPAAGCRLARPAHNQTGGRVWKSSAIRRCAKSPVKVAGAFICGQRASAAAPSVCLLPPCVVPLSQPLAASQDVQPRSAAAEHPVHPLGSWPRELTTQQHAVRVQRRVCARQARRGGVSPRVWVGFSGLPYRRSMSGQGMHDMELHTRAPHASQHLLSSTHPGMRPAAAGTLGCQAWMDRSRQ